MQIVLASTSSYRRRLLARLGVDFETLAPGIDEGAFTAPSPRALAERLAREKARAVHALRPEALVIGSDQIAVLGAEVLGKPGTAEAALLQLQRLRGKTHELMTAVTLFWPGGEWSHTDVTRLHVAALPDEALRRYVAADSPLDCAGSYKIESRGIALFDKLETNDPTAIEGLPLIALSRFLRERGFAVP
jgi:septum formation protein